MSRIDEALEKAAELRGGKESGAASSRLEQSMERVAELRGEGEAVAAKAAAAKRPEWLSRAESADRSSDDRHL